MHILTFILLLYLIFAPRCVDVCENAFQEVVTVHFKGFFGRGRPLKTGYNRERLCPVKKSFIWFSFGAIAHRHSRRFVALPHTMENV